MRTINLNDFPVGKMRGRELQSRFDPYCMAAQESFPTSKGTLATVLRILHDPISQHLHNCMITDVDKAVIQGIRDFEGQLVRAMKGLSQACVLYAKLLSKMLIVEYYYTSVPGSDTIEMNMSKSIRVPTNTATTRVEVLANIELWKTSIQINNEVTQTMPSQATNTPCLSETDQSTEGGG